METQPLRSVRFCMLRMPETSVISRLCVCCSSFIFAHSEREVHTHPDLFSTLPSRPNHERNRSPVGSLRNSRSALIGRSEIVHFLQALNDIVMSLWVKPRNLNRHVNMLHTTKPIGNSSTHSCTGLFIPGSPASTYQYLRTVLWVVILVALY